MWNADRGFGFIEDDSGGPDIFIHITALRGIEPDNLRLGERLTFDVESTREGKDEGRQRSPAGLKDTKKYSWTAAEQSPDLMIY